MTGCGVDPATVKACCAAAYGSDAVAVLLGGSYHPGGLALTRRLADQLRLQRGQRVADVACGPGTTARLLVAEYGVSVDGVDLNASTVDAPGVRLHTGDAERIPLPGEAFDAVVCECALCTFPDKQAAAAEFARLLRPGGRLGLTDVTVTGRLPRELADLAAWVACIADARPLDGYVRLLGDAGLHVTHRERHDAAIGRMLDQIEARLTLLRLTGADRLAAAQVEPDAVARHLDLARQAVADGIIGYALLIAEKPQTDVLDPHPVPKRHVLLDPARKWTRRR
jgi:arsenite methyltransferase